MTIRLKTIIVDARLLIGKTFLDVHLYFYLFLVFLYSCALFRCKFGLKRLGKYQTSCASKKENRI